jgi:hypothetical protein
MATQMCQTVDFWSVANIKLTHVKASGNTSALQRLLRGVLCTGGHKTRHFILGEFNLTTAKGREADIGDLELVGGSRHSEGV